MDSIRNFCILAHIDHGKSTLADRFLELTGTVPKEKMREQYLDMMELERERGITIKMQPCRMIWHTSNQAGISNGQSEYILDLIDTPGHVDFSYEVSRALAAVEGAILLVDATKGIQAQTIANLELARKEGLVIIPAVNKIDIPSARTEETAAELAQLLQCDISRVFLVSAKYGTNVELLLDAIVQQIPPPASGHDAFRALVFDSRYDSFRGVVAYIRIMDGELKKGEKIYFMATKQDGEAKEIGYFCPGMQPKEIIRAGEIGYIATGIKEPGRVRVGDTVINVKSKMQSPKLPALPGYKEPKPVVFASFYPEDAGEYDKFKDAFLRLHLQDPSFTFVPESREFLGRGFRCGFLGTLHLEIIAERLRREFQLALVISSPSVEYRILSKEDRWLSVYTAADWPEYGVIRKIEEPWVKLEILTKSLYLGRVTELLKQFSGVYLERQVVADKIILFYEMPLRELIRDFYSKLKGSTQGYASLNYDVSDWKEGDLVKLEVLIAGRKEEAFSQIVARREAYARGKELVQKLKECLPQQQFAVALQAQVEGKIIARETIKAARKDVTAPLYGGDVTRKRKLLEKQKKGKRELQKAGHIRIPPRVFIEIARNA